MSGPAARTPSEGFLAWRDYVASNPDFEVGKLMKRSCPQLSDAEVAAYCSRLNNLVSAVLVNAGPAHETPAPDAEPPLQPVRPRMRRR